MYSILFFFTFVKPLFIIIAEVFSLLKLFSQHVRYLYKEGILSMSFIKKEPVLSAAAVLAVLSMFFITPSPEYLSYIDFRTLALLFSLMTVVAGLKEIGLFRYLGSSLLAGMHSTRQLALTLTALCFFSSMLITNDVSLITFVPFSILILNMAGLPELMIPVIVLQTIAANLGSMATPIGNPQNLYLYSSFGLSAGKLVGYMLPLTVLSALLLMIAVFLLKNRAISLDPAAFEHAERPEKRSLIFYLALFFVCLGCVVRIYSWPVMFVIILAAVLIKDRTLFHRVDYFLLLTFVCFFIFIGNTERIPAISGLLTKLISGHEFPAGVLLSQCISNVPAAILLSGFTDAVRPLLFGVNVGGLGTLIASMASVISYRAYSEADGAKTGTYMAVFTGYNLAFLVILCVAGWALLAF